MTVASGFEAARNNNVMNPAKIKLWLRKELMSDITEDLSFRSKSILVKTGMATMMMAKVMVARTTSMIF